jgi:hypothetical protein
MLHLCNEHFDAEKEVESQFQAFAVIGISLIAMGEDVGAEMAIRSFNHLVCFVSLDIISSLYLCFLTLFLPLSFIDALW